LASQWTAAVQEIIATADYKSRWQFVPGDVRGETRLLISRTGENQQPTWLTSRLEIPVEPLRTPIGSPGEFDAGLLGYLKGVMPKSL